jgi:hypothetical protein
VFEVSKETKFWYWFTGLQVEAMEILNCLTCLKRFGLDFQVFLQIFLMVVQWLIGKTRRMVFSFLFRMPNNLPKPHCLNISATKLTNPQNNSNNSSQTSPPHSTWELFDGNLNRTEMIKKVIDEL